jgi:gluconate 2-dehydrogenase gamma chain
MSSYSTDRRGALKILGAIGATCACPIAGEELFGRTMDEAPMHAPAHNYFPDSDFKTISRISDLIIPQTNTPGAVAAGVPAYIDLIVSRNSAHQALTSDGLRWLDSKRFMELDEAGQLAILQPLCEDADAGRTAGRITQFFALVKGLTADGYYTSQAGLIEELGYKGNTMMASYPECVHED